MLKRFVMVGCVSNMCFYFSSLLLPLQLACVYVSMCIALTILLLKANIPSLSDRIPPAAYISVCNAGHSWVLDSWGYYQFGSSRLWIQLPSRSLPSTWQPVLFWDIQGLHGFTESWNGLGWKGPYWSSSSNPPDIGRDTFN